jgi:hypothetical protein
MSRDTLDLPPVYGPLVKNDGFPTDAWRPWLMSIKEIWDLYLTPFWIGVPQITKQERNSLSGLEDGVIAFITTDNGVPVNQWQGYYGGNWYSFNVTLAP